MQDTTALRCNSCKKCFIIFDEEGGNEVCGSCGLVLSEAICDEKAEWRTFQDDDNSNSSRDRIGKPYNVRKVNGGLETKSVGGSYKTRLIVSRRERMISRNPFQKQLDLLLSSIGEQTSFLELSDTVKVRL